MVEITPVLDSKISTTRLFTPLERVSLCFLHTGQCSASWHDREQPGKRFKNQTGESTPGKLNSGWFKCKKAEAVLRRSRVKDTLLWINTVLAPCLTKHGISIAGPWHRRRWMIRVRVYTTEHRPVTSSVIHSHLEVRTVMFSATEP